ncbi:hypothetical protein NPIL_151901 [Nephila pilipes]|uniref:Uncharacterized protein n=1 Tax=Nephila pilipes TaxID=299642 RepID=A0A8X6TV91_NEPPI|nr:hypothetical protein NPIL_151901 [Nephila pilipes]
MVLLMRRVDTLVAHVIRTPRLSTLTPVLVQSASDGEPERCDFWSFSSQKTIVHYFLPFSLSTGIRRNSKRGKTSLFDSIFQLRTLDRLFSPNTSYLTIN